MWHKSSLLGEACNHMCTHTHAQKCLEVQWIAHANQTLDYKLSPFNCLCLIKIRAYSHDIIIQTAVIDISIKVMLIILSILITLSILILKGIDSIQKPKRFSSQSSLQAFNPIQDKRFWGCSQIEEGGEPLSLKSVTHILQWWNLLQL